MTLPARTLEIELFVDATKKRQISLSPSKSGYKNSPKLSWSKQSWNMPCKYESALSR